MVEFVFGSLATTERRVQYLKNRVRGVRYDNSLHPFMPQAEDSPVVEVVVGLDEAVTAVTLHINTPHLQTTVPMSLVQTDWDVLTWSYHQRWQGKIPAQPQGTCVQYRMEAHLRHSQTTVWANNGETFSYLVGANATPEWAKSAIIYQIFPDRFAIGNGRSLPQLDSLNAIHGGTIRGIIEKLDYVADLGFNAIWINPFFPDDTHHGYHATDYFAVNPRMGTLEDVRELVRECHQRGIRLILDFVANHWGSKHPTFQSAQADKNSPYYDWYLWQEWPHTYTTFFGVQDLPQLNVENPEVQAHLFKSIRFWLGDVGFDGVRLDYVLGPTLNFWTAFRHVVQEVKPDAWLFGEAVHTPETQLGFNGRFHGALDFVLAQSMRQLFAYGDTSLLAFDNLLIQHEHFFPPEFDQPSFLDNHDMDRFLFICDHDIRKLKLAALCQFTLKGQPLVYYGTEVGMSQKQPIHDATSQGMAECRQPMIWGEGQNKELLAYYKWLIHFRREHPVLWQGERHTVHLSTEQRTYAYTVSNEQEAVLVVMNFSEETQTLTVKGKTFTLEPWSGDVQVC